MTLPSDPDQLISWLFWAGITGYCFGLLCWFLVDVLGEWWRNRG